MFRSAASWPLHVIALAAAFVLQAAIANGLGPASFARPLSVAVLSVAALTGLFWLPFRSLALSGLVVTSLLLATISHEPVIAVLTAVKDLFGEPWTIVSIGVTVFVPLTLVTVFLDQYRRGHLGDSLVARVTAGLNLFGAALLVVVSLPALQSAPEWLASADPVTAQEGAPAATLPDIYLILLDGYPRNDELSRQFGIDNADFTAALGTRGFDVDPASHTNYTYTALTFTSLLSMEYVPLGESGVISELLLREQLQDAIANGAAFAELRRAGYTLVATDSGWQHVSLRRGVDRFIARPELNDFEQSLLARTWLPDIPPIPDDLFLDQLRGRINGVLDDAARVAHTEEAAPRFTFVHVPAPHLPLAFQADGRPTPYDSRQYLAGRPSEYGLTDAEFAAAYEENLRYLNGRVLATVDRIRSASDRDPVIVILSDHGYNGDSPIHTESMLRSLFAAHTPGRPRLLSDSPTPVNLMRLLVDSYLDADASEPLPKRFFTTVISGDPGNYALSLTEVTIP